MRQLKTVEIRMDEVKRMAYSQSMSVTKLATKAGLSANTLFVLQSGRRKASLLTLNKIATALGVEPETIVKG